MDAIMKHETICVEDYFRTSIILLLNPNATIESQMHSISHKQEQLKNSSQILEKHSEVHILPETHPIRYYIKFPCGWSPRNRLIKGVNL